MAVKSSQNFNADVYNQLGEKTEKKLELDEEVFGLPWNADLAHQVVVSIRANKRVPVAHAKTRAEVRGGGKKPWRQKGTGRARHGSIRSPIWIGGGVSHGPLKTKVYAKKINKKMRQKALFVVLSQKLRDNEILFLDNLSLDEIKTKKAASVVEALRNIKGFDNLAKKGNRVLFCLAGDNKKEFLSFRNIPYTNVVEARSLNALDALSAKFLVFTKDGVNNLQFKNENLKSKF